MNLITEKKQISATCLGCCHNCKNNKTGNSIKLLPRKLQKNGNKHDK